MTKTMKSSKLGAFLLSLLMILSVVMYTASSVSAEIGVDEGNITIHKLSSKGVTAGDREAGKTYFEKTEGGATLYYEYLADAEYTIYKIGTFTQNSSGDPIQVTYSPVAGLVDKNGDAVTALDAGTDPYSLAPTAAMIVDTVNTNATGSVTSANLDANGVYLVKETVSPEGVLGANDFIITVPMYIETTDAGVTTGEWKYEISAFPKNIHADASIEKYLLDENGNPTDEVHANVGDIVTYQVTVTAPVDIEATEYTYTEFEIEDTASASLAIDEGTLAIVSDKGTTYNLISDYTVSYISDVLKITFTADGIVKLQNGEVLTVTYDAAILASAASNQNGPAVNKIKLNLATDGNPGPPVVPPPVIPPPVVKIYSYGIQKVGSDDLAIAGASFKVATKDAVGALKYMNYNTTTAEWTEAVSKDAATTFTTSTTGTGIDSEAILQFWNLDKDTEYFLVETVAPTGYTILPNPVKIQATKDTTDVVYNSYEFDTGANAFVYKSGLLNSIGFSMRIKNLLSGDKPGSLPATGGNGIYFFLIVGIVLIGSAGVLFVINRKKNRNLD